MTTLAWGLAIGYVLAKVVDAIKDVRAAKREANRKIAEARERHTATITEGDRNDRA